MVSPVDRIVGDFAEAGATYITFHPEASPHVDRTLQLIKQSGCKAGLVFNPATSLDICKYVFPQRECGEDGPDPTPLAFLLALERASCWGLSGT